MKAYQSQRLLEEREAERLVRVLGLSAPTPFAPLVRAPAAASEPPRRALKVCVECEAHSWRMNWLTGKIHHLCHEPLVRHPVTGAPTDPELNRRKGGGCGPGGGHWRPKPVLERAPREIVVLLPDTEPMEYVPPVVVRLLTARPPDETIVELW